MKERIVLEVNERDVCDYSDNYAIFFRKDEGNSKVEKVPETFEELKELVREKVYDDNRNGVKIGQCVKVEYILIDGKSFMPDGEILDEDNDVFAVNRTPQQMWQIIKSLIGEE